MQCKIFLVTLLFLFGLTQYGISQFTVSETTKNNLANTDEFTEKGIQNWDIFTDEDNKLFYIDFETLNMNLSDIVVKDQSGRVVMKDDVFELPVNTIYELDLSQFGAGAYEIELRSFTGVIRKKVWIN
jgi:predicted transport protein